MKTDTTPDAEKVMQAIRTLDDAGRFGENLDWVVLAGEARDAFQRIYGSEQNDIG